MQRELHPTLLSSLEGIVDQMVWFRENWHEEVGRLPMTLVPGCCVCVCVCACVCVCVCDFGAHVNVRAHLYVLCTDVFSGRSVRGVTY